jgi:anti-sigma B factor antagonist
MQVIERGQVVVVKVLEDRCLGLAKVLEPYVDLGRKAFVLDLSQVGFLDSVNIAAIISARAMVQNHGGKLGVANLPEGLKSIFRVLKLERLFRLDESTEVAITSFG